MNHEKKQAIQNLDTVKWVGAMTLYALILLIGITTGENIKLIKACEIIILITLVCVGRAEYVDDKNYPCSFSLRWLLTYTIILCALLMLQLIEIVFSSEVSVDSIYRSIWILLFWMIVIIVICIKNNLSIIRQARKEVSG